ncbi:MAG: 3-dehydroquinate synthase [Patescibacteria group bacterium]
MKKIPPLTVRIPPSFARAYPIAFGSLGTHAKILRPILKDSSCVIITDSTVKRLYGESVRATLKRISRGRVEIAAFPVGERSKTQEIKTKLEHEMLKKNFGRDTCVIALGGGVVGDLAGFVASTYCRGVPLVQMPTTLLAMVDSSIGGKVAIDTPYGKNMIGAFWQPAAVCIDPAYLESLPSSRLVEGLCEAIKMFLTHDEKSFFWIEKKLENRSAWTSEIWIELIRRALIIKAGVVGRDEREASERALLNFGHTIGHALERESAYRISHGLAVGVGVLVENVISCSMGYLSESHVERIAQVFRLLGVDGSIVSTFSTNALIAHTHGDKKARGGTARYVLLDRIGHAKNFAGSWTHPVPDAVVRSSLISF